MVGELCFVCDGFDNVLVVVVEFTCGFTVPELPHVAFTFGFGFVCVYVRWEKMVEALRCTLSVELEDGLVIL